MAGVEDPETRLKYLRLMQRLDVAELNYQSRKSK